MLTPQYNSNLSATNDVFNHSNNHFWQYMQPGYDALDFISCTGTNFLVRANAYQVLFPHSKLQRSWSLHQVRLLRVATQSIRSLDGCRTLRMIASTICFGYGPLLLRSRCHIVPPG